MITGQELARAAMSVGVGAILVVFFILIKLLFNGKHRR